MTIRLYNTLTKSLDELAPVHPDGIVRMYSCGPTVYNTAHLGNMRAFLFTDILQRTIRHVGGFQVRWVMNITDIDDKIIRDSAVGSDAWPDALEPQSGNAMADMQRFTSYYMETFLQDIAQIGIRPSDFFAMPRATDYITDMMDMIRGIVHAGYGYVSDGSVYFNVAAYRQHHHYGRLFTIDAENFREGVRIDADEYDRERVSDFVLWKARKEGEPSWDFALDGDILPGRPGWHIECSAMSKQLLGLPFDIHTGGVDLRFPHHEDELAQCAACDGTPGATFDQAAIWCHNEFLEVEGKKMSKSLGNFFTLADLLARGMDPLDVRYTLIAGHYRSVLNFTVDGVRAAAVTRSRVQNMLWDCLERVAGQPLPPADLPDFDAALADDIHVPKALAALYASIPDGPVSALSDAAAAQLLANLVHATAVLGVWTNDPRPTITIPDDVRALADARWAARSERNWAEADRLRDVLAAEGWTMKDGKDAYTLEPR
jgi:cysteinyl-tRNA synthetase